MFYLIQTYFCKKELFILITNDLNFQFSTLNQFSFLWIYIFTTQITYLFMEIGTYDLIIVGAGCMGMAMAYHAKKFGKSVFLIEEQTIGDANRYWSSSFSARQNRVQYTEKYLTNFVLQSNKYWDSIQTEFQRDDFRYSEGALWFGDKDVTTSEGNIFESNAILEELEVPKLYMQSLIHNTPKFFENFNFDNNDELGNKMADDWAALFQHDGGSIQMEATYNAFYSYIKMQPKGNEGRVVIEDTATITGYQQQPQSHKFTYTKNGQKTVFGKKIFIAVGSATPSFMTDIMQGGDHLQSEASILEYLASYFQINTGKQNSFEEENFPNWIQFLDETYEMGYGFPTHTWDQPVAGKNTVKIGTMAKNDIPNYREYLDQIKQGLPPVEANDGRVLAAQEYVEKYMKNLGTTSQANFRCPIVFYNDRETILDYANRTRTDIVVQNGGWIGKYFPLLARTAYDMLFNPDLIYNPKRLQKGQKIAGIDYNILKNFINRTTYPITNQVKNYISSQPQINDISYDTVIVGAGCSGLHSAYKINTSLSTSKEKIGIFDMLDRIAGRLWTVKFEGASTIMELGGMRYIQEHHKLLSNYVKTLKIPDLDFEMGGNKLQQHSLRAYFRNDRYRQNEWDQLQKEGQKLYTVYRIEHDLLGMTAFQMICYSIYSILRAPWNITVLAQLDAQRCQINYSNKVIFVTDIDTLGVNKNYNIALTLEDWNFLKPRLNYRPRKLTVEDIEMIYPLYKFGFQNIIEDQFSHEAYNFISEQNGYFSNTSNASYIEQCVTYVLDFGQVTYKTLQGGFDQFCYSLANQVLDPKRGIGRNEGGLYLRHELVNIVKDSDQYTLTFKNLDDGNSLVNVNTKKLILGMPKRSVQILYNKIDLLQAPLTNYDPIVPPQKKNEKKLVPVDNTEIKPQNLSQLINASQNMPAIKIIMNFRHNWWDIGKSEEFRATTQMRGVSATDLPMRQALYFGTNADNMLLASYNDMITTEYWSVLQKNFSDFEPTYVNRKKHYKQKNVMNHDAVGNIAPASTRVVHDIIRQLSLLHGKKVHISDVKEAMYQNWGNDPFGGGYHNWYAGYNVEKCMKAVRRPWKDEKIFIVGEAFSNLTGWVEGALQTAEKMLKDQYSLEYTLPNEYNGY